MKRWVQLKYTVNCCSKRSYNCYKAFAILNCWQTTFLPITSFYHHLLTFETLLHLHQIRLNVIGSQYYISFKDNKAPKSFTCYDSWGANFLWRDQIKKINWSIWLTDPTYNLPQSLFIFLILPRYRKIASNNK